jgi:hypothetical protein
MEFIVGAARPVYTFGGGTAITSTSSRTGAPQYTLHIRDWRTDASAAADTFTFKPPGGAKKVDFKDLADEDEVPAGIAR